RGINGHRLETSGHVDVGGGTCRRAAPAIAGEKRRPHRAAIGLLERGHISAARVVPVARGVDRAAARRWWRYLVLAPGKLGGPGLVPGPGVEGAHPVVVVLGEDRSEERRVGGRWGCGDVGGVET